MKRRKPQNRAENFLSPLPAILGILFILSVAEVHAASPLNVCVVNYPLAYFAERIGEEHVQVSFPASLGEDPAYWNPDVQTIAQYQQADLILLNGAGYAKWVDKVSLPRSKVVNTSKQFKERYIPIKGVVTHSHGPNGNHAHEGLAFTTWLDFDLAARQAGAIKDALIKIRPDLKDHFQANYASLNIELKALDKALLSIVTTNPNTPVIGSHPVYQYLAARYGLNIKSVHWEPDQVPDDNQWRELEAIVKLHPAGWMIWEGKPDHQTVNKLKEIGIESLVFDPCGNKPEQGDFISMMKWNVDALERAYIRE